MGSRKQSRAVEVRVAHFSLNHVFRYLQQLERQSEHVQFRTARSDTDQPGSSAEQWAQATQQLIQHNEVSGSTIWVSGSISGSAKQQCSAVGSSNPAAHPA